MTRSPPVPGGTPSPRSGWGSRRASRTLGIGILLACAAQLLLARSLTDQGHFAKYPAFAGRILAGELPRERIADLSPGYLWLVVALTAAGLDPRTIVALQILMTAATALLAGRIAGRIGGDAAAALAAAGVVASRTILVNALELEPESLILLLQTAALDLATGPAGSARTLAAGLAYGLTVAVRPAAVVPFAGVALWRAWRDRRRGGPLPWLLLVGASLGIAPFLGIARATTGSALLMNPGTVFYEGWNPTATACGEAEPRIVKDVEATLAEPDALHVAYRLVASRALQSPPDPRAANRYWTSRSVAWLRAFPGRACRLLFAKAGLLVGNHEVFDLATQRRKAVELGAYPLLPVGPLFAFAIVGLWLARGHPALAAVAIQAAGIAAVPLGFYVTTRQRNPLVVPLAILAAAGIREIARREREGEHALARVALLLALAGSLATAVEGDLAREDRRSWDVAENALAALRRQSRAMAASDREGALRAAAEAATWPTSNEPVLPDEVLRAHAREEIARTELPERHFDLALALLLAHDWAGAGELLGRLEETGYRPSRGNFAVSSVAFHRARALRNLGRTQEACDASRRAAREAPGDAAVLAQVALCGRGEEAARAERLLGELHDPFTAALARAKAAADAGDLATADRMLRELEVRIPEWPRPRRERARLPSPGSAYAPSASR